MKNITIPIRTLIFDDNTDFLNKFRYAFTTLSQDYEITCASNLSELQKQYSNAKFDLIILDWYFSDGDGLKSWEDKDMLDHLYDIKKLGDQGAKIVILTVDGKESQEHKKTRGIEKVISKEDYSFQVWDRQFKEILTKKLFQTSNEKFSYSTINIPNEVRLPIKQYLEFFKVLIYETQQITIHFELRDIKGGLEIETDLTDLSAEQIDNIIDAFQHYISKEKKSHLQLDSAQKTQSTVKEELFELKLDQQRNHFEQQVNFYEFEIKHLREKIEQQTKELFRIQNNQHNSPFEMQLLVGEIKAYIISEKQTLTNLSEPPISPNNKKLIIDFIKNNKLKEALDELERVSNLLGVEEEEKNDLIYFSSDLNKIKRDTRQGTVSAEQLGIHTNRLIKDILSYISDFID